MSIINKIKTTFKQLLELQGYHKYTEMDFFEIIQDIIDTSGGSWDKGAFGVVLIPENKNFVYKCWVSDGGYDAFIDLALKNQDNPFFPKILGKKRVLPAFFKRPIKAANLEINIIRMEKLLPVTDRNRPIMYIFQYLREGLDKSKITMEWLKKKLGNTKADRGEYLRMLGKAIDDDAKGKNRAWGGESPKDIFNERYLQAMLGLRNILLKQKKLEKLNLPALISAMIALKDKELEKDLHYDMHSGNFMERANGELVITDPFVVKGWSSNGLVRLDTIKTKYLSAIDVTTGRSKTPSKQEPETKPTATSEPEGSQKARERRGESA
jgi:hypothetical protein